MGAHPLLIPPVHRDMVVASRKIDVRCLAVTDLLSRLLEVKRGKEADRRFTSLEKYGVQHAEELSARREWTDLSSFCSW